MANRKHIDLLLEGVGTWNESRQKSAFTPDLSNIDLWKEFQKAGLLENNTWIPLREVNLSDARLTECSMRRALLIDANLEGARLWGADLTGSNLDGAKLARADFTGATIDGAELVHVRPGLIGANLTRTRPWKAILYEDSERIPRPPSRELNPEVTSVADILKVRRLLEKHYCQDTRVPADVLQVREVVQGELEVPDIQFYFRGVSQCLPLEPSVMRELQVGDANHRYPEDELLIDLISRRPNDFEREGSAIEQLVLARHYGLRTRLLDITRNPLVALFHACDDDKCLDGMLHVFAVPRTMVKFFNSDRISIIANFARLSNAEQEMLLGFRQEDGFSSGESARGLEYDATMRRLYHFIKQEKILL